jgi:hypothetical protein
MIRKLPGVANPTGKVIPVQGSIMPIISRPMLIPGVKKQIKKIMFL